MKLGDVSASAQNAMAQAIDDKALLREIRNDLHRLAEKCQRAHVRGYMVQFAMNPALGRVDNLQFIKQVPFSIDEG